MSDIKIIRNNKRERFLKKTIVLILTNIAAISFLTTGSAKLLGAESAIAMFDDIGIGQWFRYLTGSIEVIGTLLILIPPLVFWGALLLSLTMIGAILVHLFVLGGSPSIAMLLLIVTSTLMLLKPIKN
ncbi:MAG: DoxX family protein [Cyanobacteria bacterium P01_A01_bin.40]